MLSELRERIREADPIVHGIAHHTPLQRSNTLSRMSGGEVYLKLECLQRTGSFKIRGATYAIAKLTPEQRIRGCIAASAGNHAQGIAYAATRSGVKSTIVMPESAPAAKVSATQGYGAEVILHGKNYDEAFLRAMEVSKERGSVFIHAFDDKNVVAGQGTLGLELLEDRQDINVIVVPVGGGGLISGIGLAVKEKRPDIKIFGVEAEGCASMIESLRNGHVTGLASADTIADGIAVRRPSELTFNIVDELVDDTVAVADDEISYAIFMLLERCKQVVEPAGAAGLAAILSGKIDVSRKNVAVVLSGGNIDMSLLMRIVERSLYSEGRRVRIAGLLPDRTEELKNVLLAVSQTRATVVHMEHSRADPHIPLGRILVTVTLEVARRSYLDELLNNLRRAGYHFDVKEE